MGLRHWTYINSLTKANDITIHRLVNTLGKPLLTLERYRVINS